MTAGNSSHPSWWCYLIAPMVFLSGLSLATHQALANSHSNDQHASPTTALLVGHVTWQGRPTQPNARQQFPITLTLKLGATEINYPVQTTDANGFFTVSVDGLPNGTYHWGA